MLHAGGESSDVFVVRACNRGSGPGDLCRNSCGWRLPQVGTQRTGKPRVIFLLAG
jgi:hypothetical protein